MKEIEARFWSKVKKGSGCWLWVGSKTKKGYGQFYLRGGAGCPMRGAHQVSWFFANGAIPSGLCVLHDCPGGDNPACVNPAHLWLGTVAENNADMIEKGRGAKGETHGSHTRPERIARGDKHGSHTHPERVPKGASHWKAKLTEAQVLEIRRIYSNSKTTQKNLAAQFRVAQSMVWFIVNRKNWKHI